MRNSKKDVLKLIGKETVLKFSYCSDGCFYYETIIPEVPNDNWDFEDMHTYGVVIIPKEGAYLSSYEKLKEITRGNHLLEVKKLYEDSSVNIEMYFEKYK